MRRFIRRTAAAALAVSVTVLLAANVHADDTMTFEEALQASYDTVPDTKQYPGMASGSACLWEFGCCDGYGQRSSALWEKKRMRDIIRQASRS